MTNASNLGEFDKYDLYFCEQGGDSTVIPDTEMMVTNMILGFFLLRSLIIWLRQNAVLLRLGI